MVPPYLQQRCPCCRRKIKINLWKMGRRIACPNCGSRFQAAGNGYRGRALVVAAFTAVAAVATVIGIILNGIFGLVNEREKHSREVEIRSRDLEIEEMRFNRAIEERKRHAELSTGHQMQNASATFAAAQLSKSDYNKKLLDTVNKRDSEILALKSSAKKRNSEILALKSSAKKQDSEILALKSLSESLQRKISSLESKLGSTSKEPPPSAAWKSAGRSQPEERTILGTWIVVERPSGRACEFVFRADGTMMIVFQKKAKECSYSCKGTRYKQRDSRGEFSGDIVWAGPDRFELRGVRNDDAAFTLWELNFVRK